MHWSKPDPSFHFDIKCRARPVGVGRCFRWVHWLALHGACSTGLSWCHLLFSCLGQFDVCWTVQGVGCVITVAPVFFRVCVKSIYAWQLSYAQSDTLFYTQTMQSVHFYLTCGLFDGAMHGLSCSANTVLWSALPAVLWLPHWRFASTFPS